MDKELIGKTLEETESIFGYSATKISKDWYEIVLKNYCLGLLQRKLYIKCDNKGKIRDYYYRIDIR